MRTDPAIVTIDLYKMPIDSAVSILANCDGLLLTGGEDVYPGLYGKAFDTIRCTEINRHRDSLELALIAKALEMTIPVTGICRGQQLLNVALGGSLIIDIPADVPNHNTHQCEDYLRCYHRVNVVKGSALEAIAATQSDLVTTNHHQAVDRLALPLQVSALSEDRVVEGVEWKDPIGKSYLLGVQWHPERMENTNPLSGPVANRFITESVKYRNQKNKNQLK